MGPENTIEKEMQERFAQLPKVVQDAITSADVQKHLRELADTHKLHLDQWTTLENEVMLTLLGFEKIETLTENIQREVNVDAPTAAAIATDISKIVFEPIRGELERQLDHPDAVAAATSNVDTVRNQVLAQEKTAEKATAVPVVPATPPQNAPIAKVERAPISSAYASTASHERKTIEGDPYREQIA